MDTNIWGILLIVVLIGPILEEYLCRKVLLDRINQYGQGISVLVSGLIFGLIHGNFYQFFYAFGLGAIFAYIYVKTGKWKYPVVFHILINFMGSVVPLFFIRRLETVLSDDMSRRGGLKPSFITPLCSYDNWTYYNRHCITFLFSKRNCFF